MCSQALLFAYGFAAAGAAGAAAATRDKISALVVQQQESKQMIATLRMTAQADLPAEQKRVVMLRFALRLADERAPIKASSS